MAELTTMRQIKRALRETGDNHWFDRANVAHHKARVESEVVAVDDSHRMWVESRSAQDSTTGKPYRQYVVAVLTFDGTQHAPWIGRREGLDVLYLHAYRNHHAWARLTKAEAYSDMLIEADRLQTGVKERRG